MLDELERIELALAKNKEKQVSKESERPFPLTSVHLQLNLQEHAYSDHELSFFRGKDNNNNTNLTLLSSTVYCFSLVVDIIKPWLVRSAKQHQNPCSRLHLFTNRI